ncbi:hypothetical protein ASD12_21825 [Mesorhizobium sp. Root102]|uniref:hypothetical protein n=1 Tax=Mesorhizobium sp. Root102 TaxID=1736422 RepID=UPI0006F1EF5D|nr:hypothetical protein [Mesorhizobium sp. Root102]KQU97063.1 hypothetical protein ASD12_21825 [Mesorhizobium sp. Root102]
MKNGRLDEELRRMLMGHTIDRPKYGEGGDITVWQEELMKIVLPIPQSFNALMGCGKAFFFRLAIL